MTTQVPLLACLAATLYMTGLIAFVQRVHYPLFARVGAADFRAYHAGHLAATTPVVMIPMVVELLTSALLVARRPPGTGPVLAWAGLAAALFTWLVTAAWSVPAHQRLAGGFDPGAHATLVATNWLRTAAWLAHAAVVLVMTARAMR